MNGENSLIMIQKTSVSLQPFCAKRILNYFNGLGSSSQNGYVNAQVIEEYILEMKQGESVDYQIEQKLWTLIAVIWKKRCAYWKNIER